jgi:hypothetical protein
MNIRWSGNKFVALLLFIIIMTTLIACGGAAEEASSVEATERPVEEPSLPIEEESAPAEEEPPLAEEPSAPLEEIVETPAASIEEALAEIDAQLSDTLLGNIAHSAPSNMQVDETAEVTLLVSPILTSEELASEITDGGEIRTAAINITPWMHAELISPDPDAFSIRPLHGNAEQPLSNVEPTKWTWLVTAEEEGERRLILTVSRLVQVEGRESWRQVEEYRYPIEVDITLGTRIKQVTAGLWDFKWWIGGIIFPIIAYWIIKRLDSG